MMSFSETSGRAIGFGKVHGEGLPGAEAGRFFSSSGTRASGCAKGGEVRHTGERVEHAAWRATSCSAHRRKPENQLHASAARRDVV